tara:strand:- start:532 stop:1101 length:570 start_codon:yes stop_codon:yes gene_type:complete
VAQVVTGLRAFDPDDFVDEDKERRRDQQLQREQNIQDQQRIRQERRDDMDNMSDLSNAERAEMIRQQNLEANRRRLQALMDITNDDSIQLDAADLKMINDPDLRLMSNGDIVRKTGRDVIRSSGQFRRSNLLMGIDVSRRPRKKTSTDKKMSKALRLANEKFRKKNGSLRKGATQAQIMRYAHKLVKKM